MGVIKTIDIKQILKGNVQRFKFTFDNQSDYLNLNDFLLSSDRIQIYRYDRHSVTVEVC